VAQIVFLINFHIDSGASFRVGVLTARHVSGVTLDSHIVGLCNTGTYMLYLHVVALHFCYNLTKWFWCDWSLIVITGWLQCFDKLCRNEKYCVEWTLSCYSLAICHTVMKQRIRLQSCRLVAVKILSWSARMIWCMLWSCLLSVTLVFVLFSTRPYISVFCDVFWLCYVNSWEWVKEGTLTQLL